MKKIFCILFIFLSLPLMAENGMHTWRSHIAYGDVKQVVDAGDAIYALAGNALMRVDKQTEEMTCYSKQDGFHGATIIHIGYDSMTETLVLLYDDGLIDFFQNGRITALSDLQMKQISTSKKANSLTIHSGYAYLGMPFGILVINIKKQEIADTYYIGSEGKEENVIAVSWSQDSLYALTKNTLYTASCNENLLDYNVWHRSKPISTVGYQDVIYFKNRLYLLSDSIMHIRDANGWSSIPSDFKFVSLRQSLQHLYAMQTASASLVEYVPSKGFQVVSSPYIIYDLVNDNGTYWFAACGVGVVRQDNQGTQSFFPDGPAVNIPYRMKVEFGKLYVVPGARWGVQEGRTGHVMIYDISADHWVNIRGEDISGQTLYPTLDFMNVAVDPFNPEHFFVTSYGTGLYEFENNRLTHWYNHTNSPLHTLVEGKNAFYYIRTDAAMYDEQGNLWVINMGNNPIHVVSPTQLVSSYSQDVASWNNYALDGFSSGSMPLHTSGEMFMDRRNPNWKWIPYARYAPGLILYDDNLTPMYHGDDKMYFTTTFEDQDGKTIAPTAVYSVVQDRQNDLWVAIDEGLFIIPSTVDFRTSNSCVRVKIPRNDGTNLADYLLGTERINSIAVDGANRKWIGTESSGLYLFSEDGMETIEHFTTENSPLPSNQILSVAIDANSGRVFVGTGSGLMSYQSDAADPEESFSATQTYAYPNPVRPDYDGVITIRGLMEETIVKIVDNSGNLVCETRSNGGLAIWDGKNRNGQRVSSGVYSAFCNSSDGENHTVVKILIIH